MAIERRNGRVYVYESKRYGARVVRVYRGSGPLLEAQHEVFRLERLGDWLDAFERRERLRGRLARVRKWLAGANALVADALRAAGWHQHKREWRRKRGATMGAMMTPGQPGSWVVAELVGAAGSLDPATTEKADQGDKAAAAAVAAYLGNPTAAALWGDMGRRLLRKWAGKYAGACVTTEAAVMAFAADLRSRLAGPAPTALELLVAERVVLGWVFVNYCEAVYANSADKLTIQQSEFHLKRIDLAHRTLMAACRTLAKVRRSKLPDVLALVNVTPPIPEG